MIRQPNPRLLLCSRLLLPLANLLPMMNPTPALYLPPRARNGRPRTPLHVSAPNPLSPVQLLVVPLQSSSLSQRLPSLLKFSVISSLIRVSHLSLRVRLPQILLLNRLTLKLFLPEIWTRPRTKVKKSSLTRLLSSNLASLFSPTRIPVVFLRSMLSLNLFPVFSLPSMIVLTGCAVSTSPLEMVLGAIFKNSTRNSRLSLRGCLLIITALPFRNLLTPSLTPINSDLSSQTFPHFQVLEIHPL